MDESRRRDDKHLLDPKNTTKSYSTVLRNWDKFCKEFKLENRLDFSGGFESRRLETIRLCNWLQWNTTRRRRSSGEKAMNSAASFLTYAYNLQAVHKREGREWNITYEFHMMKKRLKRQYGWGGKRKLPLFITMINELQKRGALLLGIRGDEIVITIMLMTVFGLMRISEALDLRVENVKESIVEGKRAWVITLKDSKTMKRNEGKPEIIMLVERIDNKLWCPYRLLKKKIDQVKRTRRSGKIFDIKRKEYSDRLKDSLELIGYDRKLYDTHSGRIGGATMLWEKGVPVEQIKAYGRWRSDCWLWYCRRLSTDYIRLSRVINESRAVSSSLVTQLVGLSLIKEDRERSRKR